MKRRTRIILSLTASFLASVLCTGVPAAGTLPAVNAEGTPEAALPDWIPDTYGKALRFLNTYGGTHIENGLLCVVFYEFEDRSPEGEPIQHTITAEGDAVETLYHEIHQFK